MNKQTYLSGKKKYDDFCQDLISKTLTEIQKQFDNDDLESYCIDTIEEKFEDMLLHVLNFISEIYGINTDLVEISEEAILGLTFSGDGKTFKERISEHYTEYLKNQNQDMFLNAVNKILKTESRFIFNHTLSQEVTPHAVEYEIIGDNGCEECADHLGGGRVSLALLTDIPPYHPNCECNIVYYLPESTIEQ